jgi:hypothetical protein
MNIYLIKITTIYIYFMLDDDKADSFNNLFLDYFPLSDSSKVEVGQKTNRTKRAISFKELHRCKFKTY